jgi:5-methylcytosine-specific restriction endonuclease McrA
MGKYFKLSFFKNGGINRFINNKRPIGNCVLCGEYGLLDKHHVLTRSRGGSEQGVVRLCRDCHKWVDDNPELAADRGLYLRGYKINNE